AARSRGSKANLASRLHPPPPEIEKTGRLELASDPAPRDAQQEHGEKPVEAPLQPDRDFPHRSGLPERRVARRLAHAPTLDPVEPLTACESSSVGPCGQRLRLWREWIGATAGHEQRGEAAHDEEA